MICYLWESLILQKFISGYVLPYFERFSKSEYLYDRIQDELKGNENWPPVLCSADDQNERKKSGKFVEIDMREEIAIQPRKNLVTFTPNL